MGQVDGGKVGYWQAPFGEGGPRDAVIAAALIQ